jgi:hypothetical protein
LHGTPRSRNTLPHRIPLLSTAPPARLLPLNLIVLIFCRLSVR